MAVSVDRWTPGVAMARAHSIELPQRRGLIPRRKRRASLAVSRQSSQFPALAKPLRASDRRSAGDERIIRDVPFAHATRALWVWLACGLVLTLTCPPLAAAQTLMGALPLWLVGLPAVSLASVLIARRAA